MHAAHACGVLDQAGCRPAPRVGRPWRACLRYQALGLQPAALRFDATTEKKEKDPGELLKAIKASGIIQKKKIKVFGIVTDSGARTRVGKRHPMFHHAQPWRADHHASNPWFSFCLGAKLTSAHC